MTTKELGDWGEKKALNFLESKGYQLLEQNWRYKKAEIDLIMMYKDVLVFVEVKTKSNNYFGDPELSITPHKEALLVDAAGEYMAMINHTWEIRFDVISILYFSEKEFALKHFLDAFYPQIE